MLRGGILFASKSGDMYALAIIMHEIIHCQGPFNMKFNSIPVEATYFDVNSVIEMVKCGPCGKEPFRPAFIQVCTASFN